MMPVSSRVRGLLLVSLLLLGQSIVVGAPHARGQASPPMIELVCGVDMTEGHVASPRNVTLINGLNVAYGSHCEIRSVGSDAVLDNFFMGQGTDGPWGVREGQFDYVSSLGGLELEYPLEIFVRAYDGPGPSASAHYGDSEVIVLTSSQGAHYIQGWSLGSSVSVSDDGSSGREGAEGDVIDMEAFLILAVVVVVAVSVVTYVVLSIKNKRRAGVEGREQSMRSGYGKTRKRSNR